MKNNIGGKNDFTRYEPRISKLVLDYSITILNKSPNTIKEYNYDLAMFLKFIMVHFNLTSSKDFKDINISNLSLDVIKKIELNDIHAFLAYLTTTYHSKAATRARKVSSIRVFFNYLSQKANLIEKNPAQNLETPKIEKRMPKYLTLDDSKKLLTVTSDEERNKERDYAIITLFLNCGLRLSELVGININDISFDDAKMTVIGKGNKERTIYLNKACLQAINSYLEVRPKIGIKPSSIKALFLSERKERISKRTVQYVVDKELRRAGLDTKKYSTHKLRHTAATLMYQYGNVDIRALQELLGHESISTTEIYTHVANEQVRNAVEVNPLSDYSANK